MGYDLFLFVSRSAAEKFLCAVCQGVAKDVFETDCGHLFCRTCVGKLIRVMTNDSLAQCPHCRAAVTWQNVHGSRFLNREISQLQTKCNLCKEWIGNLNDMNDHQLNECPDQCIECKFKKYGCKETKIKRKDMISHNEKFKVSHLELKINFLVHQHQTQIITIKRKYEQQINQLNEEKISMEKKWRQKLISLHKQYGQRQQPHQTMDLANNINNITAAAGDINISNTTTTTTTTTTINTPKNSNSLHNIQIHSKDDNNNDDHIEYHTDGSMSYDPNVPTSTTVTTSSRVRRKKRKRSVLDECRSESDYNSNDAHNHNNSNSNTVNNNNSNSVVSKRAKKRRRTNKNSSSNVTLRRSAQTTTNRKKRTTKQTPKQKVKRRINQIVDDDEDDIESEESVSDY